MKNIWGVVRKDLDKIFKFPGAFFSTIILPGLILFIIYAFMGSSFGGLISGDENYFSKVTVVNAPVSFQEYINMDEEFKIEYNIITNGNFNLAEERQKLSDGNYDLLVVFEETFDDKVDNFDAPSINIYSNEIESESSIAMGKLTQIVSMYKQQLLENKGINPNIFNEVYESVVDEHKASAFGLSMLIPMLIITFVFAGALGIGADAIAGEKERGTLSALLMAPIKRNEIIVGKVISTSIISLSSSISSFIGIIASLPFAKEMFAVGEGVAYSIGAYVQLLAVIIVLAMFASSLLLVFSALAKTIKEASNYAMPVYMGAIILAVVSMFASMPDGVIVYAVPVYNVALALKGILSFDITLIQFFTVIISNIVYVFLLNLVLIRMFKSEKILFSK